MSWTIGLQFGDGGFEGGRLGGRCFDHAGAGAGVRQTVKIAYRRALGQTANPIYCRALRFGLSPSIRGFGMSDIASQANLSPAVSQLPVSWYFDEKIFELEKRLLFDAGPGYVGHELMVPEPNQFRSLEWLDHSKLLINRDDGFYRMSNICRHRQAVMMQGAGVADRNIVCPVHRWTYNPDRPADRGAPFPRQPLPQSAAGEARALAGPAVQGAPFAQRRPCRDAGGG